MQFWIFANQSQPSAAAARQLGITRDAGRFWAKQIRKMTRRAEEYEHEAVEHAALVDDACATLMEIQTALAAER